MTDHETEGSGVENEPSRRQISCTSSREDGVEESPIEICVWNNHAIELLIDLLIDNMHVYFPRSLRFFHCIFLTCIYKHGTFVYK